MVTVYAEAVTEQRESSRVDANPRAERGMAMAVSVIVERQLETTPLSCPIQERGSHKVRRDFSFEQKAELPSGGVKHVMGASYQKIRFGHSEPDGRHWGRHAREAALDLLASGTNLARIMAAGRWSKTDSVMRFLGQVQGALIELHPPPLFAEV